MDPATVLWEGPPRGIHLRAVSIAIWVSMEDLSRSFNLCLWIKVKHNTDFKSYSVVKPNCRATTRLARLASQRWCAWVPVYRQGSSKTQSRHWLSSLEHLVRSWQTFTACEDPKLAAEIRCFVLKLLLMLKWQSNRTHRATDHRPTQCDSLRFTPQM